MGCAVRVLLLALCAASLCYGDVPDQLYDEAQMSDPTSLTHHVPPSKNAKGWAMAQLTNLTQK